MKSVTRELPCTPVVDDVPTFLPFTGFEFGPFFIHRMYHDNMLRPGQRCEWAISHRQTGYAVHKFLRSKAKALLCAKQLVALECWDFKRPQDARALPANTLAQIQMVRESF